MNQAAKRTNILQAVCFKAGDLCEPRQVLKNMLLDPVK